MSSVIDGKMLLELDLKVSPTANDNMYLFDNTTKKSKRVTLAGLQSYFSTNAGTGNSFSGDYNDLTNLPTLFNPVDLPTDYGITLHNVATSGNYNDLNNLPTLFSPNDLSTDYGITLSTVATSGSFTDLSNTPSYTLSDILTNGNTSGTNDVSIDNSQKLVATNGTSYLDLRYGTDSIARLEATNGLYLFSGASNAYQGIFLDEAGRTIINGTLPISTTSGLSVYQNASFNKDIFSRNGVIYMYGSATNTRGWIIVDTATSRYEIGSAFSAGIRLSVGSNRERHTDFISEALGTPGNLYGRVLEVGAYDSQPSGNGSYGATLRMSASHDDGVDIDTKSANFRTTYYDVSNRNIATYLDVDNQNIFKGYNTGILETNTIWLTDDSILKGVNSDTYFNPRYNSTNDIARLHASDTLYVSTNFRQKIIIGADQSSANNGLLPAFVNNSVYQQVQITGVNLRGNISFGNGLSSSSPIIGIGSDYSELRFNTLFLRWNNATYGGASFTTNGGARFSFIDVYNRQMMEIRRVNANSRELKLPTTLAASSVAGNTHRNTKLTLENRYWSKAQDDLTGLDIVTNFTIENERYSDDGGVNYNALMKLTYNNLDVLKIYEDGSIGSDNFPTVAPTQPNRIWNDSGTLKMT